jgi:hypothetical protein
MRDENWMRTIYLIEATKNIAALTNGKAIKIVK